MVRQNGATRFVEKASVGEDTARLKGEGRAHALRVSIAGADANCPEPVQHWYTHIVLIHLNGHCCHERLPHAECFVGRLGGHEVGGPVVGHEQELQDRLLGGGCWGGHEGVGLLVRIMGVHLGGGRDGHTGEASGSP